MTDPLIMIERAFRTHFNLVKCLLRRTGRRRGAPALLERSAFQFLEEMAVSPPW
jgi:hypothetical protein